MENQTPDPTLKKVAIGIPNEGHTLPESYDNHLVLSFHLGKMEQLWKSEDRNPKYEFYWHTVGRLLTPMARERILTRAVENDMDYVLMYDDDMTLPIDMVECMLQDMEQRPEIDVLAPLAFMRNPPHYAVMYTTTEGYDAERHSTYHQTHFVKNYPREKLVECDAVGFGAVLIRVSTLKKMKQPYCFSTTGAGEDIYFCLKAKQEANARIFMDTRIKLGHLMNPKVADEAYFDKYNKDNEINIEEIPHKYNNIER